MNHPKNHPQPAGPQADAWVQTGEEPRWTVPSAQEIRQRHDPFGLIRSDRYLEEPSGGIGG